jgi:hypothetical protein
MYSTQGCAIFRTDWVRSCGGYADLSRTEDWVLGVSQAFRGRVRLDRRYGLSYQVAGGPVIHDDSVTYLLGAARRVRERIRRDPAVPAWARALIPVIGASQVLVIAGLRPLYRALRAPLAAWRGRGKATNAPARTVARR